jgi:Planctomycete cytochrome C
MPPRHTAPLLTVLILLLALAAASLPVRAADSGPGLPATLHDTGLFAAGPGSALHADVIGYRPQYPLWSDGADKQRWLRLPAGAAIDARDPDAWQVPAGTRLWKTFSLHGRPVETRYLERQADGRWRYAVYLWNDEATAAPLAPARGAVLALPQAPGGRYEVPSRTDCLACHDSAEVPVLGLGALQLSAELPALVARGVLRGLPPALLSRPPQIAGRTPEERAAMGYLHGNCGHCHNDRGSPAPVPLRLAQTVDDAAASMQRVLQTTVGAEGRFRPQGLAAAALVVPGQPAHSLLLQRLRSRQPVHQMPPLGTRVADDDGIALVERWITSLARP